MTELVNKCAKLLGEFCDLLGGDPAAMADEARWAEAAGALRERAKGTADEKLADFLTEQASKAEELGHLAALWQTHFRVRDMQRSTLTNDQLHPQEGWVYVWTDWKDRRPDYLSGVPAPPPGGGSTQGSARRGPPPVGRQVGGLRRGPVWGVPAPGSVGHY